MFERKEHMNSWWIKEGDKDQANGMVHIHVTDEYLRKAEVMIGGKLEKLTWPVMAWDADKDYRGLMLEYLLCMSEV